MNVSRLTFGIQPTTQGGMPDTLGESLWFSDSLAPSKLHPSMRSPPNFTIVLAPWIEPFQLAPNFRLSMETPNSLLIKIQKYTILLFNIEDN